MVKYLASFFACILLFSSNALGQLKVGSDQHKVLSYLRNNAATVDSTIHRGAVVTYKARILYDNGLPTNMAACFKRDSLFSILYRFEGLDSASFEQHFTSMLDSSSAEVYRGKDFISAFVDSSEGQQRILYDRKNRHAALDVLPPGTLVKKR